MPRTEVHITGSPLETESLGERFSAGLSEGSVVGLVGELGSGKTCFVRGVARGIGVKGYVKSPSFTIVNIYGGGRLPLYHIDLYRVNAANEVFEAGLEEYIYAKGISIIEWADKFRPLLDECSIVVRFSQRGPDTREVSMEWRDSP